VVLSLASVPAGRPTEMSNEASGDGFRRLRQGRPGLKRARTWMGPREDPWANSRLRRKLRERSLSKTSSSARTVWAARKVPTCSLKASVYRGGIGSSFRVAGAADSMCRHGLEGELMLTSRPSQPSR
jgi:hypothetical protein